VSAQNQSTDRRTEVEDPKELRKQTCEPLQTACHDSIVSIAFVSDCYDCACVGRIRGAVSPDPSLPSGHEKTFAQVAQEVVQSPEIEVVAGRDVASYVSTGAASGAAVGHAPEGRILAALEAGQEIASPSTLVLNWDAE
jgi:hypothetical protein